MLSPTLQDLSNQLYHLLLLISIKYSHVYYFCSFLSITNSYFISFQANILESRENCFYKDASGYAIIIISYKTS